MKFLAGTREQVVEDDWHHTEETMAPGHVTGEAMWTGSTTFYILPDKEDNYGYYVWRQEDHQGIMPSKIKKERKQDLQFLRWQDASMWYATACSSSSTSWLSLAGVGLSLAGVGIVWSFWHHHQACSDNGISSQEPGFWQWLGHA